MSEMLEDVIKIIHESDESKENKDFAEYIVASLIRPKILGESDHVLAMLAGRVAECLFLKNVPQKDISRAREIGIRLGLIRP